MSDFFKDGKTFEEWAYKCKEYENNLPNTYFQASDFIEKRASAQDKQQGKDIADYLIEMDWRLFRKQEIPKTETKPLKPSTPKKNEGVKESHLSHPEQPKKEKMPDDWKSLSDSLKRFWSCGGRGGKTGFLDHLMLKHRYLNYSTE